MLIYDDFLNGIVLPRYTLALKEGVKSQRRYYPLFLLCMFVPRHNPSYPSPTVCLGELHLHRVATYEVFFNWIVEFEIVGLVVATRCVCNRACVCGSRAVAAGAAAAGAPAHPALRTPLLWISGTPSSIRYERATPDRPLFF